MSKGVKYLENCKFVLSFVEGLAGININLDYKIDNVDWNKFIELLILFINDAISVKSYESIIKNSLQDFNEDIIYNDLINKLIVQTSYKYLVS